MAIKKISQFTAGTPTSADKILFEQDGAGKSTTIGDAVNTCSLTLEEIMATTDLSGKIASASALKRVNNRLITVSLVCQNGIFPIGTNPAPHEHVQVCCVARNVNTGSFYALWYNYDTKAFEVSVVLSGSSPSDGQNVVVQYFSN